MDVSVKKERDKLRELSKESIKSGKLINKDIPINATSADKFKYEVFQKILSMVISGKIGKDELIVKLGVNKDRLDKMLHCYIGEFTADEAFSFIDKLGMSSISPKNKLSSQLPTPKGAGLKAKA